MNTRNIQSLHDKGTIITFYSYKGGTGRSMALANVACILAERQQELAQQFPHQAVKGILMIDWDLEAPGLHRYFKKYFKHYRNNNPESSPDFNHAPGLIDFFSDFQCRIGTEFPGDAEISEVDARPILHQTRVENYILKTDIPYLSLLKAGRFDDEYPTRVSRFKWEGLFLKIDQLFLIWAEQLAERYSYVLIDSRTGTTDTSNICSMLMPEKLVAVFTPNAQSLTGITGLIEQATNYRSNSDDSRPLVVFPLPSRIDLSEQKLREFWRYGDRDSDIDGYQPTFETLFQRVYQRSEAECRLTTYFGETQIQHVPRYSYGEDIAVRLERKEAGRLSLSSSYRKFAEILLKDGPWEEAPPETGQTKRIEMIEIEALSARSSTQRKAYDYLGALITSVQATKKLQRMEHVPDNVRFRVIDRLDRVVRSIREKNRFDGHGDDVWDLSFSPSGDAFVSGSEDRTLKLWRWDGELLGNFLGHDGKIRDVSYSPAGDYIASASEDRTVRLWALDGTEIAVLKGHRDIVLSVTFSPNGQLLASCGADRTIKLWQLDGTLLQTINGHEDRAWDLSFHPDGDRFASASEDGTVKIWTLDGELLQILRSKEHKFLSVAFSPDKTTIVAGGEGKGVLRWNVNGQQLRGFFGHQDKVYCVTFNSDGSRLATASADKTLRLWTASDGLEVDNLRGHANDVLCVRFHPSDTFLASGGGDNVIRLWTSEYNDNAPPDGHGSIVLKANFSPNGEEIVSCGGSNEIKLWDLSGHLLRNFVAEDNPAKVSVRDVCFQPQLQSNQRESDRLIASGGDDETVKLWTRRSKRPIHILPHGAKIRAISFNPRGDLLLSAGAEATLKLWRFNGQLVHDNFSGHSNWILDAAFSPDGETIVSASTDSTIRFWNLSGQLLKTWQENPNGDWVYSLAFSPDGRLLVSASGQHLRLWDLETGDLRHTFMDEHGHDDTVYDLTFHPNGHMVLSASHDQTIKLWSIGGVLLKTFNEHHNGAVSSVSAHSNGRQFISSSHDKSLKLWQLDGLTDPICTMPRDDRTPNVDELLQKACAWLDDYLWTNRNVSISERYICSDMFFEQ